MKLLAKTINKSRSAALVVSAAALTLAAPAGLAAAHGSSGHSGGDLHQVQGNARVAASVSPNNRGNNNNNGGSNGNSGQNSAWQRWHLTCDQQQTALTSQAAAIKAADQKRLNGQNILYGGVQNYVTTNGVVVANYDAMNAKVATDQTAATNDINNLAAPQLDCTDNTSSAASTNRNAVAAYEQTQHTASQDLANYRHDLATLFNATLNS